MDLIEAIHGRRRSQTRRYKVGTIMGTPLPGGDWIAFRNGLIYRGSHRTEILKMAINHHIFSVER
jgi:hypothetical protein